VVLGGRTLCDDPWFASTLEQHGYGIERSPTLAHAMRLGRDADMRTVTLIEASLARAASVSDLLGSLDRATRRRVLIIGWRLEGAAISTLIAAGAADFMVLPASAAELASRVDLRFCESLSGGAADTRAELPHDQPRLCHGLRAAVERTRVSPLYAAG
jgi:hypothetical protein